MARGFWVWTLILVGSIWSGHLQARESAAPAAISEAEVTGLELAIAYLTEGPSAWTEEFQLREPAGDGLSELLEIKAGPIEGAVWRLVAPTSAQAQSNQATFLIEHPSGLEEILTLVIDVRAERRIVDLIVGSQPTSPSRLNSGAEPLESKTVDEGPTSRLAAGSGILSLGLMIAAAALWGFSWLDRRARPYFLAAAAIFAVVAAGIAAGLVPEGLIPIRRTGSAERVDPETNVANRPRDVLGLKRALAMGDDAAARRALGRLGDAGKWPVVIWRAQGALARADLNSARTLLNRAASTGHSPLLDLLLARSASEALDEVEASLAYQRMMASGTAPAAWVLEASEHFAAFGLERQWEEAKDSLNKMAARDARVYYHLARAAVSEGLRGKAGRYFRLAWSLEPLARSELLADYLLAYLTTSNTELREMVNLGSFEEESTPCSTAVDRPLRLGPGASASNVGGLLVLEIGSARVEVSSGCGVAPGSTVAGTAADRRLELDRRWLADLPDLASSEIAGIDRRRWQTALAPLARQQNWQAVADTASAIEAFDLEAEKTPDPEVLRHHATALERVGRSQDAARKLIELAQISRNQQRVDPSALLQLSEILVREQEYDRALRLIKTALDAIPFETSGQRLLQVEMEKRLFRSSQEHVSEHFRLVYPPTRTFLFADKATKILEAERRRLLPWIPQPKDAPRVDVLFLDVGDFYSSYAGQQILGLFDGRIRVPLGEVGRFDSFVVSLMTHELAHAMIAAATEDRAPFWLHEGLAQHLEMLQSSVNPIPELERSGSRLTFPLIEVALSERAVPALVQIGYDQARWTLHYLDSRYGKKGIRALLNEFKNGASTEQAVQKALGVDLERFDAQLQTWSLRKAPAIWPSKVIDYDPEVSDLITRDQ